MMRPGKKVYWRAGQIFSGTIYMLPIFHSKLSYIALYFLSKMMGKSVVMIPHLKDQDTGFREFTRLAQNHHRLWQEAELAFRF